MNLDDYKWIRHPDDKEIKSEEYMDDILKQVKDIWRTRPYLELGGLISGSFASMVELDCSDRYFIGKLERNYLAKKDWKIGWGD